MANVLTSQILLDGHRNAIVRVQAVLDTSDLSASDIVDPADFAPVPTQFRIDKVQYSIGQQLDLQLLWDATTDVVAISLTGTGEVCIPGGLQNNSGSGKTGKIQLTTSGWSTGSQVLSLVIELVKQGV